MNHELLVLVNVLLVNVLRAYYKFVWHWVSGMGIERKKMIDKKKEKCQDSAVKIINWIHKNNGYLELTDIRKPKFDEAHLDGELKLKLKWAEVGIYIEDQFAYAKEKIRHSHYEKKTEVIMMLERLLNDIKKI